ncbi:MAG: sialate O-acetylesterase [Lentisphaerae bacterium]|jgi:sialate O-acetylesterase|nr:sialate O-acetylesterase [Lentisphaerota bacterium]MBT4822928.1 sialate O-acetylesterase [Lentisphaerota bacterium]MBT5607337.1 sialate O-acetylesterase [Lentisphaerota bacterium]MBT7055345.1 sialate O-acetylesterase [Lentisphaerota bacterium]MBT7844571.1 sialate O-acetylesterase [Lentisphaerota bacterium]
MGRKRTGFNSGVLLGGVALLMSLSLQADVKMPAIFGKGMVLQRERPVPVWGWAAPGEAVTVTFAGKTANAVAGADGSWRLRLDPMPASAEGRAMTVKGTNGLTFDNVVVGEVWLCSGQSNMEWVVNSSANAKEEIAASANPLIRHVKISHVHLPKPSSNVRASGWQQASPRTTGGFTAVGYFFGRSLFKELNVPIGLIGSNWGGTRIEPWTPPCGFRKIPELKSLADRVDSWYSETPVGRQAHLDVIAKLKEWIPNAEAALSQNRATPEIPAFPIPGSSHQEATKIYNGMIHGLVPFALRGAIWYQGESNGGESLSYFHKTQALVEGWREIWGQGDLPYYLVQLANYTGDRRDPKGGDGYARIRDAQRKCLEIKNVGMAVIIDIGEARDIHPKNKQDVGKRLALWALAKDYGKDVVFSGPLYRKSTVEGSKIRVSFDSIGSGLIVGKKDGLAPVVEVSDGKLERFAIAGADKVWQWGDAVIDGQTVVVSSPKVAVPVAVRYAYSANPVGCNLYNREGLPASPFRTDSW